MKNWIALFRAKVTVMVQNFTESLSVLIFSIPLICLRASYKCGYTVTNNHSATDFVVCVCS